MYRLAIDSKSELRPLEPHHAEAVFETVDRNRERLRRWLGWVDANRTVRDVEAFIESSLEKYARQEAITTGIWCEGRCAGVLGVFFKKNETAEIGYWLAAEFEGRGLITKAIRVVLPYMFEERRCHRVEIHCAPENERSCAVAERLGFTLEGTLREAEKIGDRYLDTRIYALLRPEWTS